MASTPLEARPDESREESDKAFALFASFLEQHPAAAPGEFEDLCEAHPEFASGLRSIRAGYLAYDELFPGPIDGALAPRAALPASATRLWQHLLTTGHRGDRYQERNELGRGAMGVVLEVWDDELRRPLAMKVMRDAAVASDERRLRFLQEAQVASQLDHPGIVPVHEIGLRTGNAAYYTMRRVRGSELGNVLQWADSGHGGWSRTRAIDVLLKVCDAMRYAHAKGVVHRDLKPSNIMVGEYGEVYVMDWGLARVMESRTGSEVAPVRTERSDLRGAMAQSPLATSYGVVLGTPIYMSPEQAAGRVDLVDQRTDVYSLGAILYHLLCGHAPFADRGAANDSTSILEQLSKGPPAGVREVAPNCPRDLAAICGKAMARELAGRYQSVNELAADLRAFVEGRVVKAFEAGPVAELRKWVRRNRALSVLALIAVAVTIGLLVRGSRLATEAASERELRAFTQSLGVLESSLETFARLSSVGPPEELKGTATEWWLEYAKGLVDGDGSDSEGLEQYAAMLAELESKATGTGTMDSDKSCDGWSIGEALAKKQAELLWRRRTRGDDPWLTGVEIEQQLREFGVPGTSKEPGMLAWTLIQPDRFRAYFGFEQCAETLARLAAEKAVNPLEKLCTYDTLAFALCRLGRFDEALSRQDLAIEAAREYVVVRRPVSHARPEEWLRDMFSNRALMQRLAATERDEGAQRVQVLEGEIANLEHDRWSRNLTFGTESNQHLHSLLLRVVTRLRNLRVRCELSERAFLSDAAKLAWEEAIVAIAADDSCYGFRRRVTPQLDLYPLGADPDSRLQEFAHLPTGFKATRNHERRLVITENTGLVFVLVPGAGDDPPFFLSKFEVTNSQWSRLGGTWPVAQRDVGTVWPARYVSWVDCAKRLEGAGSWLRLPTKAEWLLACNAGRPEDWFKSVSRDELAETEAFGFLSTANAAVDSHRRNPFGFCEMLGGVNEWVSDAPIVPQAIERPRWLMGCGDSAPDIESVVRRVALNAAAHDGESTPETGLRPARSLYP